jgi:hypothetical protein
MRMAIVSQVMAIMSSRTLGQRGAFGRFRDTHRSVPGDNRVVPLR